MQSTEMTEMMEKWKIESMMNNSQTNLKIQEKQILLNVTPESMLAAIQHEKLIQSKGHSYMAKAIETDLRKERTDSGI